MHLLCLLLCRLHLYSLPIPTPSLILSKTMLKSVLFDQVLPDPLHLTFAGEPGEMGEERRIALDSQLPRTSGRCLTISASLSAVGQHVEPWGSLQRSNARTRARKSPELACWHSALSSFMPCHL